MLTFDLLVVPAACMIRRFISGKTRQVESTQYQQDVLPIFIYYTPLPLNGFVLGAGESSRTYLLVTSLDTQQARAKGSFDYGKQISQSQPETHLRAHTS